MTASPRVPEQDRPSSFSLQKAPTGIKGLDEVTRGGLPWGRPTLVTGAPGTGKTLLGAEFLVRGAREFGEPGVLLTFEESADDLRRNVASLGFDLGQLERDRQLVIDQVRLDVSEIAEAGEFDLEGLFIRLAEAVAAVGARRVVLDTLEALFTALGNEGIIRGELFRLFSWLKEHGLTTVVTGERGREGQLTRFGIEEYVSDCVIVLDQRVHDEATTRRLRVLKYRGSEHGMNEYPFLIAAHGFLVMPVTECGLTYSVSTERISTGVAQLDDMLGGGVFRGTTMLISGTAGTGKTTLAAHMAEASCLRGERALYVSFEESPAQLIRNLRSVGIDLGHWVEEGLLRIHAERASALGLEAHLEGLRAVVAQARPAVVVLDAVGSLNHVGPAAEVTRMVAREIDALKSEGITGVLTSLGHNSAAESSALAVSSLIDTWLHVGNVENDLERNRLLLVIKSRGTAHSNQVREFLLTDHGAQLLDVQVGPEGVITGSARAAASAAQQAAAATRHATVQRRRRQLDRRAAALEAQVAAMRAELESEREDLEAQASDEERHEVDHDAVLASAAQRRAAGWSVDGPPRSH